MRTFSFGGGVQSVAVLVLAARKRVQYDYFLFSNVGKDSENPGTLEYFQKYAIPYAEEKGIRLIELHKTIRSFPVTLYEHIMGENRSVKIPVYLSSGAPGSRNCTTDWKIEVISKWLKQNGATRENPAITGLGISTDEIHRARTDSGIPWQTLEYPLIDLRMSRKDCIKLIQDEGLPVPPKSSCWFCPYKRTTEWQSMKRENPELFNKAIELEKRLNEKRNALGKDVVYLHRSLKALNDAIGYQHVFEFDDDVCESGYCFV